MRSPGLAAAAALVLAAEGVALAVIAGIELLGLGAGTAASLPTGVALIVLTLIGAVALLAFAYGAWRGRGWARSGGVVLQVLGIALALASLGVQPVPWTFVIAVGAPALLGGCLLIASAAREGAPERRDGAEDAASDD